MLTLPGQQARRDRRLAGAGGQGRKCQNGITQGLQQAGQVQQALLRIALTERVDRRLRGLPAVVQRHGRTRAGQHAERQPQAKEEVVVEYLRGRQGQVGLAAR